MTQKEIVISLWELIDKQKFAEIKPFFHENAVIHWNNSNEAFSINGFIQANTQYPGKWDITIERLEENGDQLTSVVLSALPEANISFYAISFFKFQEGKIILLDEYWSENAPAPQWRQDLKLATPIK